MYTCTYTVYIWQSNQEHVFLCMWHDDKQTQFISLLSRTILPIDAVFSESTTFKAQIGSSSQILGEQTDMSVWTKCGQRAWLADLCTVLGGSSSGIQKESLSKTLKLFKMLLCGWGRSENSLHGRQASQRSLPAPHEKSFRPCSPPLPTGAHLTITHSFANHFSEYLIIFHMISTDEQVILLLIRTLGSTALDLYATLN